MLNAFYCLYDIIYAMHRLDHFATKLATSVQNYSMHEFGRSLMAYTIIPYETFLYNILDFINLSQLLE